MQARVERDTAVERQNALFATIPDALMIVRNGTVVDGNEALVRLSGREIQELIGQDMCILCSTFPSENEIYSQIQAKGFFQDSLRLRQLNREIVTVKLRGAYIDSTQPEKGCIFILTPT